jgi:hypothetical protein
MTLNQVLRVLKGIADTHRQLRGFYFGDASDWAALEKQYPACLVTLQNAQLTGIGAQYEFSFYLCDLIGSGAEDLNHPQARANTIEVQSDMVQVLEDMAAAIDSPKRAWVLRNPEIAAEIFDFFPIANDLVAGVKADITLQVVQARNCSWIPAYPGSDVNEGGVFVPNPQTGNNAATDKMLPLLAFKVGVNDAPMNEGDRILIDDRLKNKKVMVFASGILVSQIPDEMDRHIIKNLEDNYIDFVGGVYNRETIEVYAY